MRPNPRQRSQAAKKRPKPRVLCVDDEPNVLQGISLQLRRHCKVTCSSDPAQALELVAAQASPFAVVISDMRMPHIDGAKFLARVRTISPHTVRLLLTGDADMTNAVAAVNDGQIFRFLTKPCKPPRLVAAVSAAAAHHDLITAERVLLEHTLRGSVKALADVLALASPLAFGCANRIQRYALELAHGLGLKELWPLEVAALLSQVGSIVLPTETAEKYYLGSELSDREQAMVARMPKATVQLLGHIPRLDPVLDLLDEAWPSRSARKKRSQAAQVLSLAMEFDRLESTGTQAQTAVDLLRGGSCHDHALLDQFARTNNVSGEGPAIHEIAIANIRVGMVFAEDVRTRAGALFVARGYQVTPGFLSRVHNLPRNALVEPVLVTQGGSPTNEEPS